MKIHMVVVNISRALLLDIEAQWVVGNGGCHHFHQRCGGRILFFSAQENNDNTLHTNLNSKIVEDSKNSI